MLNPSKRGEIATLLTIGAVIFLGISTLVSSTLLKNTQTTKSKASTGTCRDNPETPPTGYTWKADCARACSSNSDCPKNTSSGYVDPNSSSWCYGFESGFRCLQLQYGGGGGSTGSQPGGTTSQPSGSGINNGCFTLAAEFEPRNEGGKWAFYAWVRFSGSKTGDVQLMYNGTHVAGWNRKPGPDDFVYDPSWTQSWAIGNYTAVATLVPGGSTTVGYQGFLSGCTPQDITVSCTLTAGASGASVSGTGCVCRGCSSSGSTNTTPPTAVPTTPSTSTGNNIPPTATNVPISTVPVWCVGNISLPGCPAPTVTLDNCTLDYGTCYNQCKTSCTACNNGKYKCPSFAASTSIPVPTTKLYFPFFPVNSPTPTSTRNSNEVPGNPPTATIAPETRLPAVPSTGQLGGECIKIGLWQNIYKCNDGLVCNESSKKCEYPPSPTVIPTPTPSKNKFYVVNGYPKSQNEKVIIHITGIEFTVYAGRNAVIYGESEIGPAERSMSDYSAMCPTGTSGTVHVNVYFYLKYVDPDGTSSSEVIPKWLGDEIRCNGDKEETLVIEPSA